MDVLAATECFHLAFCNRLAAKVDRRLFSLKGGCNLRFYFQSIRYSEDIDFDVQAITVDTLKKHVNKILNDQDFRTVLKNSQKIEIVDWSAPKQTNTTQRWKVRIQIDGQLPIPTKIEFSRRESEIVGAEIRPVTALITSSYKLQPVLLPHYMLPKSKDQKKKALETLMSVSFDDFKSQAWPYLQREHQESYDNRKTWDQIQSSVVKFIEGQPEKT